VIFGRISRCAPCLPRCALCPPAVFPLRDTNGPVGLGSRPPAAGPSPDRVGFLRLSAGDPTHPALPGTPFLAGLMQSAVGALLDGARELVDRRRPCGRRQATPLHTPIGGARMRAKGQLSCMSPVLEGISGPVDWFPSRKRGGAKRRGVSGWYATLNKRPQRALRFQISAPLVWISG
jgi:hypothetical protein